MPYCNPLSIQYLKGVGPNRKTLFENLGVSSVEDLLYLFPRRYEDRRNITPISQVVCDQAQTIFGTVENRNQRRSFYTKKHVTEIIINDRTGRMTCVWFNQPYLEKCFRQGQSVVCYGKVVVFKGRLQMVAPEYEILSGDEQDDPLNMQRIVPIYPLTRGFTQKYLRKLIRRCLDEYASCLVDELPLVLRRKYCLADLKECLYQIHFPDSMESQDSAMRRISFEEFYFFQVSILLRRQSLLQAKGFTHTITDVDALGFLQNFPFDFTAAQKRVIQELRSDMSAPHPMLRLLQGDVGCGKTAVAFFGCMMAAQQGYQAAVMAPTEILARQHFETINKYFTAHDFRVKKNKTKTVSKGVSSKADVSPIELLISDLKKSQRVHILDKIKNGETRIVIGTHALLSRDVIFNKLSYVVVDEQHKFGVRQRALLSTKGKNPDTLIMTATPIPRSLCMTLYGDLDLSIINEMPPGRSRVLTEVFSEKDLPHVYAMVRDGVKQGRQAYFVFPLVEESQELDLKAAETMFKDFQKTIFQDCTVGLVHGKMKREQVETVMRDFKSGLIQILVATTVLEVGVDVPNATIMVIEHAQRFGLAQLHQLRGRIGRGQHQGVCFLVADDGTEGARIRLETIKATTDGFEIAQKDLEMRGPGRYFGRHQHGLNELRIFNPLGQMKMLELAREEAKLLIQNADQLEDGTYQHIHDIVCRRYPSYLTDIQAG